MEQQRYSRQTRYLALAIVLAAAVIAGIWYAKTIRLEEQNAARTIVPTDRVIASIMIGALKSPAEAEDLNPRLEQKSAYTTDDQLVMRITSEPAVREPFEVGVRLLEQSGKVVEIEPPSVTFQPGTSSFCCWQVTTEGNYTLQIFRPEKVISTIPLVVKQAFGSGGANYKGFKLF